jgi:serine phosphatase RsbU (regulator of sigma subunit)
VLTRNALHAAETYLRTHPVEAFAGMSWSAFRGAVLLHLAKLASQPYGQQTPARTLPGQLPRSHRYHSEVFFLPFERVGDYWFSGDWFGGLEAADGSLWILVADITGHGYHAYLLASTLAGVWQRSWESAPASPVELLASMHDLLEDCLPEGVYVECTLVRLHPDGEVIAAPAGGSRLMFRCGRQAKPILVQLRGAWLGLLRPSSQEQQSWTLDSGDELLLATDGLYDQLHEPDSTNVVERLGQLQADTGLFERVRQLLDQALKRTPQKDDITMVLLRRHDWKPDATAPLSHLDLSSPNETTDVSV